MDHDKTRRSFLKRMGMASALATKPVHRMLAGNLATPAFAEGYVAPTGNIRVPTSDDQWKSVEEYITEPGPEYRHASGSAFEAFRDIKYGVRIHWGLYSILEWWNTTWPFLNLSFAEMQEYEQQYKTWNPSGFNADEWMKFFQANGMKMFAITCNHHDGFSMYDTKRRIKRRANWTSPGGPTIESCDLAYGIMETPVRRDVVGELCDAGRKHGLKIDLYFSHPNWYDADFRPFCKHPLQPGLGGNPDPSPAERARMMASHRQQLTELLTNYDKIDMVCLDMWLGKEVWPLLRETMVELRKLQPDVMFRARHRQLRRLLHSRTICARGKRNDRHTLVRNLSVGPRVFLWRRRRPLQGKPMGHRKSRRYRGQRRELHGRYRSRPRRQVQSHGLEPTGGSRPMAEGEWRGDLRNAATSG